MLNFTFAFLVLASLYIGNAALSIFMGILFAYFLKPPSTYITHRMGTIPLQIGIVLLGATIGLPYALNVSSEYLPWISMFVIVSFFSGLLLGKILGVHHRIAFLLSSGAAICGGTAMAAMAPIIKAKPQELLVAMTIVFLLNALAIILFPMIVPLLIHSSNIFIAICLGLEISFYIESILLLLTFAIMATVLGINFFERLVKY